MKTSAAATAGIIAAPYIAKSGLMKIMPNELMDQLADDNIMIIIEMFGGNDGLNTIIPYHQEDEYVNLRPRLNVPKNRAVRFGSSDLYMHPALVENVHNGGLMRLMEDGRLAVIDGVGYDNPNLSHFRSQEIWSSGINSSDANQKLLEGWLGRYFSSVLPDFPLVIPEHPLAVQIGGNLSLLFKSSKGHMGINLTDPDKFYADGIGLSSALPLFDPESNPYHKEFNFAHVVAKQSEIYADAVKTAYDIGKSKIKVQYSDGLAQKFAMISALISGGLKSKVYYVNISNFDFHAQQANTDLSGQHWLMLNQVSSAISEFLDDAVQNGFADRVAGMTISEFGRRAYDNASRGTDHGAGSMQFVFAGSDSYIKGGYYKDSGKPDLFDLDEQGNMKHQFDFRRTYTDFMQTWFGADDAAVTSVFGASFAPLAVLEPRFSSVEKNEIEFGSKYLSVSPNPSFGDITIKFELKNDTEIELSIYNLDGSLHSRIASGMNTYGVSEYKVSSLKSGSYYCILRANGKKYMEKFIVSK